MKKLMYILLLVFAWELGKDDNNTLIAVILATIPIVQILVLVAAVVKCRKKKTI